MNYPLWLAPLSFCLLSIVNVVSAAADEQRSPGIPEDYKLVYSQDFTSEVAKVDFVFSDANAWKITAEDGTSALELTKQSDYKPPHRSPLNIALLGKYKFSDCIIEVDCLQTGREYGHRDMIFVFGFQDPANYYYSHIATQADDHANQIFIVKDAPRLKISLETNKGNDWGLGVWHRVRIERKVSDGTIKVYFDNMAKPIMVAESKQHGDGFIGFGSFDDTGKFTSIKVWSHNAQAAEPPEFPEK